MHQDKENFNVSWHNYSEHLRDMLEDMSSDDSFADVTLVTDDKKQLKAHRNILSACSSVFKEIFQNNTNNSHPVIYLRGIQYSEMSSILQLIYSGESNFHEKRMEEFLSVAKNLGIKAALGKNAELEDSEQVSEENVKSEHGGPNIEIEELPIEADAEVQSSNLEIDNVADKQFSDSSHLRRHIESKHEGVKYACNLCDYQATQQGKLTIHIQSVHEGVKYACNQCDKQFTKQSSLTSHIQSIHEGVKYACL